MKESDLFPPVKAWLEENGHTVYSEVAPKRVMGRADVVGVTPLLTTVVELKKTLSLDLIEQAIEWIPHANYVYVAIPRRKKEIKHIVCKLLRDHGIGLIEVDLDNGDIYINRYRRTSKARLNRKITGYIKSSLTEYHLEYSPDGGHAGGGYITPYRITMIRVKELLQSVSPWEKRRFGRLPRWLGDQKGELVDLHAVTVDGWLDMNTILLYCETHYASPRASLAHALQNFEHSWCEVKKEKGKLYFRLREGQESDN